MTEFSHLPLLLQDEDDIEDLDDEEDEDLDEEDEGEEDGDEDEEEDTEEEWQVEPPLNYAYGLTSGREAPTLAPFLAQAL